mmetsp:Transcript_2092/g.6140  ORF Transcript_2092/g.6140 Transcript_2092/m.6140 type:complete len:291 (-) Transcript_2092:28-900(-)
MAKAEELSTDWQKSAGDFACVGGCERKRLPASEFSKKQVDKALESLKTLPERDIRTGPDIKSMLFLNAVCKKCMEEREAKERAEAEAKRGERQQAAEEAEANMGPPERVSATLSERPFGMTPAKAEGAAPTPGYLVVKVSEGKPAAKAGVRPGWRVAEVSGSSCEGLDLEGVQTLLKGAELPVQVTFESVPNGADFCTACQQVLAGPLFSRKMRTKPPDKRRCSACVEAAEGAVEGEGGEAGEEAAAGYGKPQSKLSEFQQLCADSAKEAEKVTGLRAVRGAGRGRGGRR